MPLSIGSKYVITGHRGVLDGVVRRPKDAADRAGQADSRPPRRQGLAAALPRVAVQRVRPATAFLTQAGLVRAVAALPRAPSHEAAARAAAAHVQAALAAGSGPALVVVGEQHGRRSSLAINSAVIAAAARHAHACRRHGTLMIETTAAEVDELLESARLIRAWLDEDAPSMASADALAHLHEISLHGEPGDLLAAVIANAVQAGFDVVAMDVGRGAPDVRAREAAMRGRVRDALAQRGGTVVAITGLAHLEALLAGAAGATAVGIASVDARLGEGDPYYRRCLSHAVAHPDVLALPFEDACEARPVDFVGLANDAWAAGGNSPGAVGP